MVRSHRSFFEDDWPTDVRDFSFVEIESARSGSIILTLALGGVAVWGLAAFALGLRRSRLGRELSRLGENAGNILADGLGSVNDRLEDWSEINQRLRNRQTKVTLKRIEPDSERWRNVVPATRAPHLRRTPILA